MFEFAVQQAFIAYPHGEYISDKFCLHYCIMGLYEKHVHLFHSLFSPNEKFNDRVPPATYLVVPSLTYKCNFKKPNIFI